MAWTYPRAAAWLAERTDYERMRKIPAPREAFHLERMRDLCRRLGDPQRAVRWIHVAGTKGKGSTAAFLAAGLSASGLRTGLYVSPHVADLRERITVEGGLIPPEAFADGIGRIAAAAPEDATFFEILTVLAFLHFKESGCAWGALEVGLGGRLDATNVVEPDVCAITPIGLDHTEVLGDTLAAIAGEKAGILKPGVPCFSARQAPEAEAVIAARAKELGIPLYRVGVELRLPEGTGAVATPWERWSLPPLRMGGAHQRENAALAVGALAYLRSNGVPVDPAGAAAAFAEVQLPGRIERREGRPTVVIDGAHTTDSAGALAAVLGEWFPDRKGVLIFACQQDKRAEEMLRILLPGMSAAVFTRTDNPRATDPASLADLAGRLFPLREGREGRIVTAPDAGSALARARELAGPDGWICAAGSLYLAGEIHRLVS